MAAEHASVRVNGYVYLLGAQAGRQDGHRQNCGCALQVN